MHDTAYQHGRLFFELYGSDTFRTVIELGSQDVNGSLRDHCPPDTFYVGLDIIPARGVDLVVQPGTPLPLATDIADAVVASSAFEHDICFWDTFLELVRILRPGGLLYLNAPSNGDFHRHPLDCWRFYPDAGIALVAWAARHGLRIDLVESFIGWPQAERWADFVAVFRKAGGPARRSRGRIADHAAAINIHHPELPPGAPLGAESRSMPDTTIATDLRAELSAAALGLAAVRDDNARLTVELAKSSANLAIAAADLATARQHNDTLSVDLAASRQAAAALHQRLNTAERQISALEHSLAEAQRHIVAMENSTSWRLTASLRWLVVLLRGH